MTFPHALRTAIFDQILIIRFIFSFSFVFLFYRSLCVNYTAMRLRVLGFPWDLPAAVQAAPIWGFAAFAYLALVSIAQLPGKLALA